MPFTGGLAGRIGIGTRDHDLAASNTSFRTCKPIVSTGNLRLNIPMFMRMLIISCFLLVAAQHAVAKPAQSVPPSQVAAGTPLMVDSNTDPEFAIINARVDIGALRQVDDAIEAQLTWPLQLGSLRDMRAMHPEVTIPEGSRSVDVERVVCRTGGALSYRVANRIVGPDGATVLTQKFDAVAARTQAEDYARTLATGFASDPRSLVCWAVARKCENKLFTWPPPPNDTPLEYSDRATKMRAAYNRQFIPSCRIRS